LRANTDTTSLAGISVLIADAPVTAGVLSAFALKRRRPTYKNVMLVLASQILQVSVKRALTRK
jgi:hypothetical protein